MAKKPYIDSRELWLEVKRSKENNFAPTPRYGELMILLVSRILRHQNFSRYEEHLKEDLTLFSYEKLIKALRPVQIGEDTPENWRRVFNYLSRTVFNAFYAELKKYYKQRNIQRLLTQQFLDSDEARWLEPDIRQRLQADLRFDFDPNYRKEHNNDKNDK